MLLTEHDWIDGVNAVSTLVVAVFTVAMFLVVKYQLQASKDIERAWLMQHLGRDPFEGLFLCENTSVETGKLTVTTTAFLQLKVLNDGKGPVWVKQLQARMVLVDSVDELPTIPELNWEDDKKWYPAPFVDEASARFRLTVGGSRVAKNLLIVFGKLTYQDKFRQERFSTFGYIVKDDHGNFDRLKTHPEYNRNT